LSDENFKGNSLIWRRSPEPSHYQYVGFAFLPDFLSALQPGDEVEFIASFYSSSRVPSDRVVIEAMNFQGGGIQKVPH
jgi:hypothetical protein